MAYILQNLTAKSKGSRLQINELPFRVAFKVKLDNGFELKDMTREHILAFHRFISDTVYKKLTISQVDKLYT